jgi:transcriptional regulator with XRE-family HTH domain
MGKRWLQQRVFSDRIKEFCQRNGYLTARGAVKMDEVADLFNLQEDSLRQFLYDSSRRRPHVDTLTRVASVVGVSVAEFLDDPGAPVPPSMGISLDAWSGLSDRERALASALVAHVANDDLSVAEKEGLYNIFLEAKKTLLGLKAAAAAQGPGCG